jgi:hypothetical protein
MGAARPEGAARLAWNAVLGAAVLVMVAGAWLALRQNWSDFTSWLAARP